MSDGDTFGEKQRLRAAALAYFGTAEAHTTLAAVYGLVRMAEAIRATHLPKLKGGPK